MTRGVGAAALLVGTVVWLGALTGWPGWWVSLMVVTALGLVVAVVHTVREGVVSRTVTAAVLIAATAAAAGAVSAAATTLHTDRAVDAGRAELRRLSGDLICRILTRGTDADRVAALAAATGELADRLRSGASAVDAYPTQTTTTQCTPARTGVGAVADDAGDVIVAVNVTDRTGTDRSSAGRVVAAHLVRVDGTWKVATLDLVR